MEMQAVPIKKYMSAAWRLPPPCVNCRYIDSFGKKFWKKKQWKRRNSGSSPSVYLPHCLLAVLVPSESCRGGAELGWGSA